MAQKLSEAVVHITTDRSKLNRGLSQAERQTKRSTQKMSSYFNNVQNKLNGIGNSLTNIGKQMSMGGGIGLAAVGAAMTGLIKPAANLQEELLNVSTLFDESQFNIDSYRKAIIKLSTQVPKSTKDLTRGLYQIQSAGISAEHALGFLKTAAVASTAGLASTESTIRALTKTLKGFGLGAESVTTVANKFFRTIKIGQTELPMLAETLPTVTAAASNAGLSINEMLGAFATGSKVLKDSAQTAVGLAGMLRSIGKASDEQKEKAKELGFEFSQQALETKGLVEFLGDMRESLEGTNVSFREFFRREQGYRLAVALLGDSFDTLKENIDDVADSEGAVMRAFEKQMRAFNNQARLAWNNIVALVKSIGTELLPEYTELAKRVRAVASVLNDNFNNAASDTRERIARIISTVAKLAAGFFGLITVAGLLSLGFGLIIKAAALVMGAISLLTSPITLLMLGILALATAWKENWFGIRDTITNIAETIQEKITDIIDWITKLWDKISKGDWSGAWQQITNGLSNVWKDIKGFFARTPEEAERINKAVEVRSDLSDRGFLGAASMLPDEKVKPGIIYRIQDAWNELASWEGWGNIWSWVKDNTTVTWNFVKTKYNETLGNADWWGNIWDSIVNAADVTWEFVKKEWKELKEWEVWGNLWDWIVDKIDVSWDWIKKEWNETLGNKDWWGNIGDWIAEKSEMSWDWLTDKWDDVKNWNMWSDIGKWISEKSRVSWNKILGLFNSSSLEKQTGNSGLSNLLDAIYQAEGGKTASVPYGMTQFKEQGFEFGKKENQEMFKKLSEGLEPKSDEWFRAAAATTVSFYWKQFKEKFNVAADKNLADLSKDMQNKFIDYLGQRYAPASAHELNENWIGNVQSLNKQQKMKVNISELAIKVGKVTWDFASNLAESVINKVADFYGWSLLEGSEDETRAYSLGKVTGQIIFETLRFAWDKIVWGKDKAMDYDPEKNTLSMSIIELLITVWSINIEFMRGIKETLGKKLRESLGIGEEGEGISQTLKELMFGLKDRVETNWNWYVKAGNEAFTWVRKTISDLINSDKPLETIWEITIKPFADAFYQLFGFSGTEEAAKKLSDWFDGTVKTEWNFDLNGLKEVKDLWNTIKKIYNKIFGNNTQNKSNIDFSQYKGINEEGKYIGKFSGKAEGGKIKGKGSGKSDSILARLSNGEFVINAESTKRFLPLLQAINSGSLPGYNQGGLIGFANGTDSPLNIESAKKLLSTASGQLGKTASSFFKIISNLLETLLQNLADRLREKYPKLAESIDGFIEDVQVTLDEMKSAFEEGSDKTKDITKENLSIWQKFFKNWKGLIQDNLNSILQTIGQGLKESEDVIISSIGNIVSNIKLKFEDGLKIDMEATKSSLINSVAQIVKNALSTLITNEDYGTPEGKSNFSDIGNMYKNFKEFNKNEKRLNNLKDKIAGAKLAGGGLGAIAGGLLVGGPIGALIGAIFGASFAGQSKKAQYQKEIDNLKNKLQDTFQKIKEALGTTISDVGRGLAGAFSADTYQGFVSNFANSIQQMTRQALIKAFLSSEIIKPLLTQLSDAITTAVMDGTITAKERKTITDLYKEITDKSSDFYKALKDLGISTKDVAEKMNTLKTSLRNAPSFFKATLARFRVAQTSIPSAHVGAMVAKTGLVNVKAGEIIKTPEQQNQSGDTIYIQGDVYGYDDFQNKVNQARDNTNIRRNNRTNNNPVNAGQPFNS